MVDINNLTESQEEVAVQFIESLLTGKAVTYEDFPGWSKEEFEEVADAVVQAVNQKTEH